MLPTFSHLFLKYYRISSLCLSNSFGASDIFYSIHTTWLRKSGTCSCISIFQVHCVTIILNPTAVKLQKKSNCISPSLVPVWLSPRPLRSDWFWWLTVYPKQTAWSSLLDNNRMCKHLDQQQNASCWLFTVANCYWRGSFTWSTSLSGQLQSVSLNNWVREDGCFTCKYLSCQGVLTEQNLCTYVTINSNETF